MEKKRVGLLVMLQMTEIFVPGQHIAKDHAISPQLAVRLNSQTFSAARRFSASQNGPRQLPHSGGRPLAPTPWISSSLFCGVIHCSTK